MAAPNGATGTLGVSPLLVPGTADSPGSNTLDLFCLVSGLMEIGGACVTGEIKLTGGVWGVIAKLGVPFGFCFEVRAAFSEGVVTAPGIVGRAKLFPGTINCEAPGEGGAVRGKVATDGGILELGSGTIELVGGSDGNVSGADSCPGGVVETVGSGEG